MYSVCIEVSNKQVKDVSFTIPDFLKKYVEDAKCYDDYIFQYEKQQDFVSTYDTDTAKKYQIAPEAYGVYFIYETPDEGVKKHYKIDDFYESVWEYVDDYNEDKTFHEVKPKTLEEAMKKIEELEKKLAETKA